MDHFINMRILCTICTQKIRFMAPFVHVGSIFVVINAYLAQIVLESFLNCFLMTTDFQMDVYTSHCLFCERDEFLKKHSEDSQPRTTVTSKTNEVGNTVTLQRHHEEEEVKQQAGFWGYLMLILYQTCAGASMLTDIVFWCLLLPFQSDGNFSLNLLMGAMHGLNLLFLLLDTALNNLPFPWFRVAYFVFWSCTYILFQWILHASGVSWWPYAFLELSTPWAPMWYLAIALIHLPCFGFYVLVVKVKNSIFSRVFPRAYLRSY
ncbi:hypothetical protein IFM89_012663 [Coptis chinensis]|uniref:Uncharacterized protein n=1 Tax=Coptis chinensis TaxID=261450 RepID=A0A835H395_9MAGN|nr:hypothetical protein IFM89_012663 [Coptis chinensis]